MGRCERHLPPPPPFSQRELSLVGKKRPLVRISTASPGERGKSNGPCVCDENNKTKKKPPSIPGRAPNPPGRTGAHARPANWNVIAAVRGRAEDACRNTIAARDALGGRGGREMDAPDTRPGGRKFGGVPAHARTHARGLLYTGHARAHNTYEHG